MGALIDDNIQFVALISACGVLAVALLADSSSAHEGDFRMDAICVAHLSRAMQEHCETCRESVFAARVAFALICRGSEDLR